ncbi:hypothetical protein A2U01_0095125, partial [Trifolium medium]|nr:hypothetical protein [Trifolium medium]
GDTQRSTRLLPLGQRRCGFPARRSVRRENCLGRAG